jgi:hypothetical protein
MRFLIAILAAALMTLPAHAQGMGGRQGGNHQQAAPAADKTKKADEQAYKDALKRIPVPEGKPDPWKSVR